MASKSRWSRARRHFVASCRRAKGTPTFRLNVTLHPFLLRYLRARSALPYQMKMSTAKAAPQLKVPSHLSDSLLDERIEREKLSADDVVAQYVTIRPPSQQCFVNFINRLVMSSLSVTDGHKGLIHATLELFPAVPNSHDAVRGNSTRYAST